MPTYKVKNGQTLFDIALHLYGTIEGLFDLLISNPDVNMSTSLEAGQLLEYHDEFVINQGIVDKFASEGMVISNGERHVYHKMIESDLKAIICVPSDLDLEEFVISGDGIMSIDWGDNSDVESVCLSSTPSLIYHYFDNIVDERRIRIYGDFTIQCLDVSRTNGNIMLTRPLTVDEFVCQSNDMSLQCLFLFKDIYSVDLKNTTISDLSPVYDMSLMFLDLRGVKYQNPDILTGYLKHIRDNYGTRRACKVYLDTMPSQEGMQAIQEIISEPEWNIPTKWEFHINDIIYTATDGTDIDGNI